EDDAFKDERFGVLARLAGLADEDHARGKMLRVWRQCTAQATHVMSALIITGILGSNGVDALVQSGLGEVVSDGVRICGTGGRIEWLGKLRKNGRKGGKAKAKQLASNSSGNSLAPQEQEKEQEKEQEPSFPEPGSESQGRPTKPSRRTRRSGEVLRDPAWAPSAAHLSYAKELGVIDVDLQAERFRNHHDAKGSQFKSWDAAFRTWLGNAIEFGRNGSRAGPGKVGVPAKDPRVGRMEPSNDHPGGDLTHLL
ncbi:MAG: hypothetical protein ABIQ16_18795, partial [Polyangiaceae bacterium]